MPKSKLKFNNSSGVRPPSLMEHTNENIITTEEFFIAHEKFMQDKVLEGLSERTLSDHIKHINFFKNYIKSIQRSGIDHFPIDIEIFKKYLYFMLQDKEYKPCTINIRMGSIKCYLRWLYTNKYLNENLALKLKKVKVPEDTIKPLSDEDVKKMLMTPNQSTYAGFRDFSIMIITLDCGIRLKELCNFKIDDVDLKNGFILVTGKNAKTRKYRELPVGKQSCTLLKKLVDTAIDNNCEYIFNSTTTSEKLDELVVTKNFEKYGKIARIKVRCTPYIFRHTFATNAVKAYMDAFTLQKIMRHENISTTRKYVKLQKEDLKKSHNKISPVDKYFEGGKK